VAISRLVDALTRQVFLEHHALVRPLDECLAQELRLGLPSGLMLRGPLQGELLILLASRPQQEVAQLWQVDGLVARGRLRHVDFEHLLQLVLVGGVAAPGVDCFEERVQRLQDRQLLALLLRRLCVSKQL